MATLVICLALTAGVVLAALLGLLALMRAGIRRQERAACLICHPPGLSTAIARRVLRLEFRAPSSAHECRHARRVPVSVPSEPFHSSAKKEAGS
jgi:hypothetical protein